jgi:translation initiation factor IF-3
MIRLPRINGKIRASEVKVVSEDGVVIGIFTIADALKLVASRRVDLVEIEPKMVPPVCQAIEIGKYHYRWLKAEKAKRGL